VGTFYTKDREKGRRERNKKNLKNFEQKDGGCTWDTKFLCHVRPLQNDSNVLGEDELESCGVKIGLKQLYL
jgi:hypothetical protein